MPRLTGLDKNAAAFLDMIARSEGTAGNGDDGYNVLFASRRDQVLTFSSYKAHPAVLIDADGKPGGLESTAAGRYQLLARYWPAYRDLLKLPDFSPESQDRIALQQVKECGALDLVAAGKFEQAVRRVARIWASLPGAGYGQHENLMGTLIAAYEAAGGTVT